MFDDFARAARLCDFAHLQICLCFLFFVVVVCAVFLHKRPAFHGFHDKVLLRRQRLIGVRAAALRATLVQITVQPQTEFATVEMYGIMWLLQAHAHIIIIAQPVDVHSLAGTDRQALRIALDEVQILAGPVEHFEAGIELVQQRLAGAIEQIGHVQSARCQRSKYLCARKTNMLIERKRVSRHTTRTLLSVS